MGCRWTGTQRSRCSPGLSDRGRAGMPRRRRCARRGMARVLRHAPGRGDRRPAQPGAGAVAARGRGSRGARYPGVAARGVRGHPPLVEALLAWRKAERIATTYGYGWLDENLGADGRLRGAWTGSDGAAGRMTASAGLHNMPAGYGRAVVAAQGHLFVRADLGQIEPRVLAAVSGDPALALATQADDMYARRRRSSASTGPPPKSRCSARCTARPPGTAARGAPAAGRLPRGDGATSTRPTATPGPGGTCAPTAAGLVPHVARAGSASPAGPRRAAPRPLRAQRAGPGRGGRTVQDVGGHRAGPGSRARRADRAVPARRAAGPRR